MNNRWTLIAVKTFYLYFEKFWHKYLISFNLFALAYLKAISAGLILTFGLFILIKVALLVLYKNYSNVKCLSMFKENYVTDGNNVSSFQISNNKNLRKISNDKIVNDFRKV